MLYMHKSWRYKNSPIEVKQRTRTPSPCGPALSDLPPRCSFLFSYTHSANRIRCPLFLCGSTAFISSDLDGTIFVPPTVGVQTKLFMCCDDGFFEMSHQTHDIHIVKYLRILVFITVCN
jgi:hypothetical protein